MKEGLRLVYVAIDRFKDDRGYPMVNHAMGVGCAYDMPKGMTKEQAYLVVSYLLENVCKNKNDLFTYDNMKKVNTLLRKYNFVEKDEYWNGYISGASLFYSTSIEFPMSYRQFFNRGATLNNLVFIGGDKDLIKWSFINDKKFDWFTPNVTKEQVDNIYKNELQLLSILIQKFHHNHISPEGCNNTA